MTLLWFLLALIILVTFHEFGHFYVARLCGVKVLRFSVGFGKPLFTWTDKLGTDYTLAPIPLGGFVKMLDEREGKVEPEELPYAFTQKSVWQRMAIVSAGPVANFILAIVLYFILAVAGIKGVAPVVGQVQTDSLAEQADIKRNNEIVSIDGVKTLTWSMVFEQLGARIGDTGNVAIEVRPYVAGASALDTASIRTETNTIFVERWLGEQDRPDILAEFGIKPLMPETDWILQTVVDGGAADKSGLIVGDTLLTYDGQSVNNWREWVEYVQVRPNQAIDLEFLRDSQRQQVVLTPEPITQNGQVLGKVGLGSTSVWPEGMIREIDYSFFESIVYGFEKTYKQGLVILSFIKKLILLDVSTKNLGGAFTIAEVAGGTAAMGWTQYVGFLAAFSISLGVFNLLPIPVLDGGHLLFYIIEAIKGKPLPEKWQLIGFQVGLFFIVGMMVLAHYNDLVRLLS